MGLKVDSTHYRNTEANEILYFKVCSSCENFVGKFYVNSMFQISKVLGCYKVCSPEILRIKDRIFPDSLYDEGIYIKPKMNIHNKSIGQLELILGISLRLNIAG